MKPVQYFSDEYLERCRGFTPEQALTFLEEYRRLQRPGLSGKSKLISLKVPELLLEAFRQRCEREGVKYQTQIKRLMHEWLIDSGK